jgi:dethiobiotin synthetase
VVETSDPAVLLRALGRAVSADEIASVAPWRFRAPLSPDLAAARENRSVDFDELIAFSRKAVAASIGMLVIEGVGGIMVPLDGKRTVLDWMAALDIPLLLVVGGYLGTISHTLTALDVLAQRKLTIAGIVVSESERDTVELDDTVASIARFTNGVEVIGLPRLPGGLHQHPAFARIAALL